MAKNNNLTDFLTDLANSFRTRYNLGSSTTINPQDFSTKILNNLQTSNLPTVGFVSNTAGTYTGGVNFHNIPSSLVNDQTILVLSGYIDNIQPRRI